MIGQIVGELQPCLLSLLVGGAGDVQVKVGIGPYLSIRVKAWGSNRSLKQKDTVCNVITLQLIQLKAQAFKLHSPV